MPPTLIISKSGGQVTRETRELNGGKVTKMSQNCDEPQGKNHEIIGISGEIKMTILSFYRN